MAKVHFWALLGRNRIKCALWGSGGSHDILKIRPRVSVLGGGGGGGFHSTSLSDSPSRNKNSTTEYLKVLLWC